jgi:dTDP-4-dehydrorhamnose 3,5-epimerase
VKWTDGEIHDVGIQPFKVFSDDRGWLAELFRTDEIDPSAFPEMGYLSATKPDVARGPHEHVAQTDRFAFFHGTYQLFLWDARSDSPTTGIRQVLAVGSSNPIIITVPPGVVHAYQNIGEEDAFVLNFPDKLFAGPGKKEPVDEIRHEDQPDSPYTLEP